MSPSRHRVAASATPLTISVKRACRSESVSPTSPRTAVSSERVGDDVTDEDAFACGGPGGLVAVRVGRCAATAAMFRLDEQAEVEMLLHALIQLAPRSRRR